jgi:GT2 family glycosyltransferase
LRAGVPRLGATAMIRKSWWDKVNGMREQFNLVADVDLWMRLSRVSQVGYVPEPVIHVRALRPGYYPDIYTGKGWHWRRLVFVYKIHASNLLDYLALDTLGEKLQWFRFRLRLSCRTGKWLIYALLKRRPEMITSSYESVTEYDLWPLRAFRLVLQLIIRPTKI